MMSDSEDGLPLFVEDLQEKESGLNLIVGQKNEESTNPMPFG